MVATGNQLTDFPSDKARNQAGKPQKVMRVSDLAQRRGMHFESRNDRLSPEDTLFRGEFWHRELRRGLYVHASNVFEETDFTALSALNAGLSCIFFLEGAVEVEIGGRGFHFQGLGGVREGLVISSVRPESFRRVSSGRQHIRHLVISVTPEWLDRDGLASVNDRGPAREMLTNHLISRQWTATPRLAELVGRMLAHNPNSSMLEDLLVESAAVEILAEALSASTHQSDAPPAPGLSRYDRARLRRAEDYVVTSHSGGLRVEDIAREAGVSASGLQRLFKAAYGSSVLEHVRGVRLEQARTALSSGECSIKEASAIAGYSSAANFATAYRRRFGVSPRHTPKRQWNESDIR